MRKVAWRLAATLLSLAAPAPACAAVVQQPNDPFFPPLAPVSTWVSKLGWTPPANDVGYPVIAIVDSGLWSGFDDFAGYLDDESADCVNKPTAARRMEHPTDVEDTFGHGTQVATLAAAPANGKGSVGVSPNSHVIVVRATLRGESFNMACAFNYLATIAKDQPMVVNVSITFSSAPPGAQAALDRLIRAGALVVAAAGNSNAIEWPASAPHVLAVGRDDGQGATGSKLDLVAPGGGDLRLPDLTGQWMTGAQGTSYSSPIVAGAAARVWGPLPIENPQAVTYLLRLKAKKVAGVRAGLIDIRQSLAAGLKSVPQVDDVEPNDRQALAQVKRGCARKCTLQGLVTKSDDPDDYWRLSGRRTCGKMKVSRGVKATCFPGPGRRIFVRVHAKKAMALYSIVMR